MAHQTFAEAVAAYLTRGGVQFETLSPEQVHEFTLQWLDAFDPEGRIDRKHTTTKKKRNPFWDYFSMRDSENCVVGPKALELYQKQWPAEYVVVGEAEGYGYRCTGAYVDFSNLLGDIYVSHHNMKWTMIFTHEQEWDSRLGPFFCSKE
jgi:hypothetical protein